VDFKEKLVVRNVKRGSLGLVAATALAASFALAGCSGVSSRDDFAARVKDKSEQEVKKEIGKPAAVDNSKPDRVTWTYTSRTFNVENKNKVDPKTVVVFTPAAGKLKVAEIVFEQDSGAPAAR
jgi:hypothetical protein